MNEEITKDRSPRSPMSSLQDSIELTRKFYAQARTAAVKPESAVKAMGYSGMTGTSMTTLGTLGQYGLVERNAGTIMVSSLAVRILHPSSEAQREAAIREAALMPKVFQTQLKGFEECAPEIVTNHLIQEGFAPDRAKKVAQVYLENRKFAKLYSHGSVLDNEQANSSVEEEQPVQRPAPSALPNRPGTQPSILNHPIFAQHPPQPRSNVLTTFKVPFAESEAEIIFTGEKIAPEDFDALSDYVAIFKKQYERKLAARNLQEKAASLKKEVMDEQNHYDSLGEDIDV